MAYLARVLKVMIASPGDLEPEREIAREVIHGWNAVHSEERGLVLMPVGWESHASPQMGVRPQEVINVQLLRDCDLLIGIFWMRLGTPTGVAPSGTVEEIEEHLERGKPALLYFSAADVPHDLDTNQLRAVREYRDQCQPRGLTWDYSSTGEFRGFLTQHLAQTVIREFADQGVDNEVGSGFLGTSAEAAQPALSDAGSELLLAAADNEHGMVLSVETMGGAVIKVGAKAFETGDARSAAKWRAALNELRGLGYLEDYGRQGQAFRVTEAGYRVADLLRARAT